jgi:hypothetical protein
LLRLKKSFLAVHVVLPILLGGLIYLCWRDPDLLMFKWFRGLRLEPTILQLRLVTASVRPALPFWFVYSLPDGLWVYALTSFMAHIWTGSRLSFLKIFCLSAGPVLGAGSELGQGARLVPGSFDWTDFVFYITAAAIAFFVAHWSNPKRSTNEHRIKEDFAFAGRARSFSFAGFRQRVFDE